MKVIELASYGRPYVPADQQGSPERGTVPVYLGVAAGLASELHGQEPTRVTHSTEMKLFPRLVSSRATIRAASVFKDNTATHSLKIGTYRGNEFENWGSLDITKNGVLRASWKPLVRVLDKPAPAKADPIEELTRREDLNYFKEHPHFGYRMSPEGVHDESATQADIYNFFALANIPIDIHAADIKPEELFIDAMGLIAPEKLQYEKTIRMEGEEYQLKSTTDNEGKPLQVTLRSKIPGMYPTPNLGRTIPATQTRRWVYTKYGTQYIQNLEDPRVNIESIQLFNDAALLTRGTKAITELVRTGQLPLATHEEAQEGLRVMDSLKVAAPIQLSSR